MLLIGKDIRSKNAFYGSVVSLTLKLASVGISFFSIPVVLNFVSKEIFGIWLVISSTFAIINVLDFGLGDGLRNKFAEAKALNDISLQKKYVSTTYFSNLILSVIIIAVFFAIDAVISWHKVFNLPQTFEDDLSKAIRISIVFTSLQFFLQAILNLLKGDQSFAQASIIGFILNLFSLVSIFAIKILGFKGDLSILVIAYFAIPNISLLLISIYFFLTRYRNISPSLRFIRACHLKELLALSSKFFVINVFGIVSLQLINLLVIREFSATVVTDFNLLYRYYFVLIAVASIIFNPLWTSFTDAIVKKDDVWVRHCLSKCYRYTIVLVLLIPMFVLSSNKFISYWSGHPFKSSIWVNMLFGLWVSIVVITEPIKMFIKGSGVLNSYIIISFTATILQVIISIFLIRLLYLNIVAVLIGVVISQISILYILIREKNRMLFSFKHT